MQDLLHRTRQVIVAKHPENTLEVCEGKLVRFEKRLLRRARVRLVKRGSTSHRPHRKDLQLDAFTIHVGLRLVPIDLHLNTPVIALRNKDHVLGHAQLTLAPLSILPQRSLSRCAARNLDMDPIEDPSCCVPLLPQCLAVRLQHRIDQRRRRGHLHRWSFRLLTLLRNYVPHRLTHHPTMDAQLPHYTDHRSNPKLILPANLLV